MSWFGRWGEARRSKYEIRETKLEKISGQGEINQDGRAKPRYCNPRHDISCFHGQRRGHSSDCRGRLAVLYKS